MISNALDPWLGTCDKLRKQVCPAAKVGAFFDSSLMQNTSTDLYRDAIAMAVADNLPQEQIKQANLIATTGSEFNIAIWAAIRLQEMANR